MLAPILIFMLLLCPGFQPSGKLDEAILLYYKGEFKQAAQLLSQLSRSSPENPDLRLWLGKSYLKTREWSNAVREMEKAVELAPSNAQYHLWLGRALGARASHTVFFKALGLARRVVKEFETASKLAPEDLDIRFDLLDYYISAPGIVGGSKEKAEAQAQAIARLNPKKGYVARAMIFEDSKNPDLAGKELLQATIDYPGDSDAHKDLADFLLARKDFEGALVHAQRALALDSGSKRARLLLAAARIRLRSNLEEAGKALQELAAEPLRDEDPAFEEVYGWLGEFFHAKGDKTKARAAFQTALVFNPEYEPAKDGISKLQKIP